MPCYTCKCGKQICEDGQDECDNCHRPIPNEEE